ncbi:ABC transporter substrate-binding protein [Devosia sp. 1635]|uniref:ABC transporter substrate-binding protein n=1 Tax=Devosia sp. 1635 TaxID=2726066 RepID=UPI0015639182|nr:ABC transporter substrate-binding protein [Devosia sp. 1635]
MKHIALLAAASTFALGGAFTASAQEVSPVTIQIDGAAVPYYLPLFVADHYGYFEDEGLDVDFLYANAADILTNVAVGNVQFGFPNGDAVIAARANDLPVKVVHTTYQNGIGAVLFKTSSGIQSPAELAGKTVAVTSYGSPNYIQLQVMMAQAGLSIDDVNVEVVGTGAIVEALASDQVDAIAFSMLRYYNLQADGIDVGMLRADDYLPSKGNVLVTSESFLDNNPTQVAGFISALNKGIQHIADGNVRTEIGMAVAQYTPTFAGQEELVAQIISEVFLPSLWQSEDTAAHELGYGNLASWQKTIDTAVEYDVIPEGFEASELVVELPSSIQ